MLIIRIIIRGPTQNTLFVIRGRIVAHWELTGALGVEEFSKPDSEIKWDTN